MYIDCHAHLTDSRLLSQIQQVLQNAEDAQVELILVPTTSVPDIALAQDLAQRFPQVYFLAGVHPEEVSETDLSSALLTLKKAVTHPKCVGIGEIGLDFYVDPDKKSLDKQLAFFKAQLTLALESQKPVVIHMREAEKEMEKALSWMKALPTGQFHCWAGSMNFLQFVLERHFYVSFCGNLTYKSAGDLRELCQAVPLERLLLETDSPYLAPEGKRGSLNEPQNVKILAGAIGQLRQTDQTEIGRLTTQNARQLFKLK